MISLRKNNHRNEIIIQNLNTSFIRRRQSNHQLRLLNYECNAMIERFNRTHRIISIALALLNGAIRQFFMRILFNILRSRVKMTLCFSSNYMCIYTLLSYIEQYRFSSLFPRERRVRRGNAPRFSPADIREEITYERVYLLELLSASAALEIY